MRVNIVGSMIVVLDAGKTVYYHYLTTFDARREFEIWDKKGEPYGWYRKTICDV